MFFTKAGLVIAWLLFVPSAAGYTMLMIAAWTGNFAILGEVFGNRFLASSGTFVQGIALGVAFGIAAEISRAIAAR
jgi:hypothetical protein